MKFFFFIFLGLFVNNILYSQINDSTLEVRISLLEKSDNLFDKNKLIDVGISFINHSSKNIFIPKFGYEAFNFLTLFEKNKSNWIDMSYYKVELFNDINKIFSEYYDSMGNKHIAHKNIGKPINHENEITFFYKKRNQGTLAEQNKILATWLVNSRYSEIWYKENKQNLSPIFLKAHQELKYFSVISIEKLIEANKEYKIDFLHSSADLALLFKNINISDDAITRFPNKIFEYELYIPKQIITNTIYFSTISIPKQETVKSIF